MALAERRKRPTTDSDHGDEDEDSDSDSRTMHAKKEDEAAEERTRKAQKRMDGGEAGRRKKSKVDEDEKRAPAAEIKGEQVHAVEGFGGGRLMGDLSSAHEGGPATNPADVLRRRRLSNFTFRAQRWTNCCT